MVAKRKSKYLVIRLPKKIVNIISKNIYPFHWKNKTLTINQIIAAFIGNEGQGLLIKVHLHQQNPKYNPPELMSVPLIEIIKKYRHEKEMIVIRPYINEKLMNFLREYYDPTNEMKDSKIVKLIIYKWLKENGYIE